MTDANLITGYREAGYVLMRSFFQKEEVDLLRNIAKEDKELDQHSFGRKDGEGGTVRLSLWNHPGEGIYGAFARCNKMTEMAEVLLSDEPYHYHSKMIMKDAQVGGAWAWHQDYGYWYQNGVLTPNLVSAFIAVDPANKTNGCLQVIRGSHHCGRIEHTLTGDQAGADPTRVDAIMQRLEHEYIEMNSGDVIFFHSNLLHRSDRNRSESPRWSMICCYNARSNDPYFDSHHPRYTPLVRCEDSEIIRTGRSRLENPSDGLSFLDPNRDESATSLGEE